MSERGDDAPSSELGLLEFPTDQVHLMRSKFVPQTFKIQVMQPAHRRGRRTKLPVVYATDANWSYEMFRAIARMIQLYEQDCPPFILVGIGYPSDLPIAGAHLRMRDFSFPRFPRFSVTSFPWSGVLEAEEGTGEQYRGEDFHRFIADELIPFVDETYDTEATNRTYFGHSGGASFGLFSMLRKPTLFRNYILSSPGLRYRGEAPGGTRYENCEFACDEVKAFIASGQQLDRVRLLLSAGRLEDVETNITQWQVTSGVHDLAALLNNAQIPGLQVTLEIFPEETHMTAWPTAFIHGVQAVFGTRKAASVFGSLR